MDGNLASRCGDPSPPPAARGPGADRPPVRRRSTIGHRSDRRHEIVPSPPVGSRRKMVQVPAAPRSAGRAPRMSRRANATWSALRTTRVVVGRSAADRVAVMGLRRMTLAEGFAETAGHPSCPSMGHPGRTHERPLRRAPRHSHFSFLDGASRARRPGRRARSSSGWPGSPSRTTRASTARSASRRRPRRRGCIRSSASRSSCSTRWSPTPTGWSSRAPRRAGGRRPAHGPPPREPDRPVEGVPLGRARSGRGCPAIGRWSRRTCGGSARRSAGRISCCSPGTDRLAEPVPARLPGEPRRAPRRVPRFTHALLAEHTGGPGRAVGLSRRGGRAAAPGRAIGRGAGGRGAVRGAVRRQRRGAVRARLPSWSSSTTSCPTTTGSSRRRRPCRRARAAGRRHE